MLKDECVSKGLIYGEILKMLFMKQKEYCVGKEIY
jgi:hypothetical protein